MRHRKSFNHLSRTAPHRKAMMANMASSLIKHKRITTTTAKAKALRSYIEPLITKSKDDTTHSRRVVFSQLQDKEAVTELFREVAGKIADRPGGYTRILKIGTRLGDSAEMAIIELVDYNENLLAESEEKTKSRRRRRGSGVKKKSEESAAAQVTAEAAEEVESQEAPPEAVADAEPKAVTNEEPKTESAEEVQAEAQSEKTEEVKDEAGTETTGEVKEEIPSAETTADELKDESEKNEEEKKENGDEDEEEKKNS